MKEATLKLFKAIPIKENSKREIPQDILTETIKRGFVFSPEIAYNYTDTQLKELINLVESHIGLTANKMNASFHKSWGKVSDAPIEQLYLEQILHYFTTYGFELFGIGYKPDSVYIPNEVLELPNNAQLKLTVIRGYTNEEIKQKLIEILGTGIALKEDTIRCIMDICDVIEIAVADIEKIKNKEVRITLYNKLDLIPENPVEFLRYVIFEAIGKTLLIKDKSTIESIKQIENYSAQKLFIKYKNEYGLARLSEIFYRFKPIFLAFKTTPQMKHTINKISKLAIKNHKPMSQDYLNNVTSMIKHGNQIDTIKLQMELDKVNTFRKIRLAYALRFRTKSIDSILYQIRNGKSYATSFNTTLAERQESKRIFDYVIDSIVDNVSKNVRGKKIYIPEYINYALPATEKQFTGNFPSGTYVTVDKDLLIGVYWEDVQKNRIDLDLAMMNATKGKFGWDARYRNSERSILFSGDITSAPNGATELYYVSRQDEDSFIMTLNYFNYDDKIPVPYKIIVSKEHMQELKPNYMVNPENVICIEKSIISRKQKMLGILVTEPNENRFYFCEGNLGNAITSSRKPYMEHGRKFLFDFYQDSINLKDIFELAGAIFVNSKAKCDIDLSPEALEKDTIINLLKK